MRVGYKQLDVAEKCYLGEATWWIALGRVPEACPDADGLETRGNWEAVEDGYKPPRLVPLHPSEFVGVGAEIDYDEYIAALVATGGSSLAAFLESIEESNLHFKKFVDILSRPDEEDAVHIKALEHVDEAHSAVESILDRARVKLLSALMDGDIMAIGYHIPEGYVPDEQNLESDLWEVPPGPIPTMAWSLTRVDWAQDLCWTASAQYNLMTLTTSKLFELFPSPLIGTQKLVGTRFGQFVLGDTDAAPSGSRPRGRPMMAAGIARTAIRNWYLQRRKDGDLPDKTEAVLAEAIEWAARYLEVKVSRTSVRRWLTELLDGVHTSNVHK